ncbi:MAG: formylmethanofuran dehydrogenase subunit B, partial [Gemmataceae bacterium]|nr:formylmethanofuran dehydrogenase subunit B [Gemmataceae bacterium]
ARSPLVYGLARTSTGGIRAAVALADRLGATIDPAGTGGPAVVALQQAGQSTCSLGEVKARADLVVFWGSDPVSTHPRHLERYSLDPPGRWVPGGRKDRFLVVVDEAETETAKLADLFVPVTPGRHWEALWTLRMLVRGIEPRPLPLTPSPRQGGGRRPDPSPRPPPLRGEGEQAPSRPSSPVPPPPAGEGVRGWGLGPLAARMTACRFGVVFSGDRLTAGRTGHRTAEALFQLVADLNDRTRFYARRMGDDVSGAGAVLTWQTGYPFGVNLGRGYPRYNPGEFTGPDMLARGEVDVCLLVGSDAAAGLPDPARAHLGRIPVVALDPPEAEPTVPAAVAFTTAAFGVHGSGTAHRMDDVTIPLRVLLPTAYPGDDEVLGELLKRVSLGRRCRPRGSGRNRRPN